MEPSRPCTASPPTRELSASRGILGSECSSDGSWRVPEHLVKSRFSSHRSKALAIKRNPVKPDSKRTKMAKVREFGSNRFLGNFFQIQIPSRKLECAGEMRLMDKGKHLGKVNLKEHRFECNYRMQLCCPQQSYSWGRE